MQYIDRDVDEEDKTEIYGNVVFKLTDGFVRHTLLRSTVIKVIKKAKLVTPRDKLVLFTGVDHSDLQLDIKHFIKDKTYCKLKSKDIEEIS